MTTPRLLPPNSTLIERALETVSRRLAEVPAPLRDLKDAWTCPVSHLPWLAYELSVDTWNPAWPEAIKRSVIAYAIEIQRRKGTVASVRQVVTAFGGNLALREWWQMDPPGEPYTFELVLTLNGEGGQPATARFVEEVIQEVARTKPARAHFSFTQGLAASAGIVIASAARVAGYRRLRLEQAPT